jgi:hypothetical protein
VQNITLSVDLPITVLNKSERDIDLKGICLQLRACTCRSLFGVIPLPRYLWRRKVGRRRVWADTPLATHGRQSSVLIGTVSAHGSTAVTSVQAHNTLPSLSAPPSLAPRATSGTHAHVPRVGVTCSLRVQLLRRHMPPPFTACMVVAWNAHGAGAGPA